MNFIRFMCPEYCVSIIGCPIIIIFKNNILKYVVSVIKNCCFKGTNNVTYNLKR